MEKEGTTPGQRLDYEAPHVERALTPAELEREILYAGGAQADLVSTDTFTTT